MAARILFLLLFVVGQVFAQEKDYPRCEYSYFKKGKIASSQCFDKDNRWGKARAFNGAGAIIYEKELRKVGGHSSVQFKYYESGAVKSAYWSSAPDGGIQWYRSTTSFSEDGKVTGETKDSYDNGPGTTVLRLPGQLQQEKTKPTTEMACAVIYSSEFWVTNTTRYTVEIEAIRKFSKTEHFTTILKPGEASKLGQMIGAEQFNDPDKFYDFLVKPIKGGKKQRLIIIPSDKQPENVRKENRRYYYEVRRIV